MPTRQLSTSPPSTVVVDPLPPLPLLIQPHQSYHLLSPLHASTASACSFFLLFLLCFRRNNTEKRTAPSSDSDSTPPYRFSYTLLRRATNSFSTLLGRGGFGPVFFGALPPTGKPIAVKLMDSASLQGEREFHNELFFASRLRSHHVVPLFGFSSDEKRRRFLLVYELMHNGNLQDALLRRKCHELMDWNKRFAVVMDIANGIQYLHFCDPPVIHGDIKPSNILLDRYFSAKIGDFGLARLKSESQFETEILSIDGVEKTNGGVEIDDGGSVIGETESMNTNGIVEQSPEGVIIIPISEKSPETIEAAKASPEKDLMAAASSSEVNFNKACIQGEEDVGGGVKKNGKGLRSNSVKDYVMEWIGKEVNNERPKCEGVGATTSSGGTGTTQIGGKPERKKSRKQLEWWESMDEEKDANRISKKKEKKRPAREWWKEEYSQELEKREKKKKKEKNKQQQGRRENSDDAALSSGYIRGQAQRNSYDSGNSGEIPKSGGISSTPSMRGTIFYVAPEYGYSGDYVSEKSDVYSFGVLLLVIISGRRPLQVTNSPLSEFKRANLLSWARHCARNGKLLEVIDESIQSLDKEQALLCITVALLCLRKSPSRRPSMKEVVGMLNGELKPPQLPVEYSPSTSSRFPFKSRKQSR